MTAPASKFGVLPEPSPANSTGGTGGWGIRDVTRRLFTPRVLWSLFAAFVLSLVAAEAWAQYNGATQRPGVLATMVKWLPLILFGAPGEVGGFVLNLLVGILTMILGTISGVILGIFQVSRNAPVRVVSTAITQFFRNSPWLVLLFFAILLIPYQVRIGGHIYPFPAWLKGVAGLTLPIMGNIAEITRGAINSIPTSQWESAESLAFTRAQTFRLIILPQCVKRMTPPWMNWYSILTMETTLISIVGVSDSMTLTQEALAAEGGRSELLIPMYLQLLLLFFLYCYPIARWTQALERRYSIVT